MSRYVFKLPDLGEGMVSAEIIAWRVAVGDEITEDQPLVEMSTDKAVVEVPAPVSGRVTTLSGKPGDVVAVGSDLVVLETAAEPAEHAAAAPAQPAPAQPAPARPAAAAAAAPAISASLAEVRASPSTRRRASDAGVDLRAVTGTGPGGRIQSSDLDALLAQQARGGQRPTPASAAGAAAGPEIEEIPLIGIRRVIAQRMAESKRNIPHFAYVEEVDVTELEALRVHLNQREPQLQLTYLPLIVLGLVGVLREFPQCNALFDAERNLVRRHRSAHVGIATQTSDGLKVPVVRNAEGRDLRNLAAEIRRVTAAARDRQAPRELLSGSTITVTSLGKLGGIASTPVINAPEVAIIGVNKAVDRPMVVNGVVAVRRMMNLSSSFDHRIVDGHDAASMIQALKERLEYPARLFMSP